MTKRSLSKKQLQLEISNLRTRLEEAEGTLCAIQRGEVDALVVSTECGEQVFTLKGADHLFRVLVENMSEGALTLTVEGVILYANQRFAQMLKRPLEKVIGSSIFEWVTPGGREILQPLLRTEDIAHRRVGLDLAADAALIPAQVSLIKMYMDDTMGHNCVVVTDLTEHKKTEAAVNAGKMARVRMEESERSRQALLKLVEAQRRVQEALRQSEQQLASELKAAEHLQELSTRLIQAHNVEVLYDKILDTAKEILCSDFASLQLFSQRGPEVGLSLLRHRGFSEDWIRFWEWITPSSRTSCGLALKTRRRVIIPDVQKCRFLAGSKQLGMYLQAGIQAMQTTPLISRTGTLLGVFSTHWREPHKLTASEIRSLDVLARQAADLIDRKQAEVSLTAAIEKLKVADYRKDEFLGTLSHEIRNPLASIIMCLSLLERVDPGGEKAGRAREIMGRQAGQLSRLVDDLLDVTRITRNKIELKKEQVELYSMVRRTVEDYQSMFHDKGVVLQFKPGSPGIYVEADPARLAQVVGNLLHNAVKYTEKGGYTRVDISCDDLQQQTAIRVEDNGIGMTRELMQNLFVPFMQGETPLDRHGTGGLGLGLALVKGLVELHGGTVSTHSDGPGRGSVFTVHLPLSSRTPVSQPGEFAPEFLNGKRRVLIIEDIKDVADSLRSLLVEEGHEVMVAHDGNEGLAKAKKFRPDVVLCDIGLPGMNGYQVARAFCADDDLKNVYLVSLTGYARPGDKKRAKEAGFHHQLAKPVKPVELRKALG